MTLDQLLERLSALREHLPGDTPVWIPDRWSREPDPHLERYPTEGRPFLGDETHEVVEL
jgi:hypothetical protein